MAKGGKLQETVLSVIGQQVRGTVDVPCHSAYHHSLWLRMKWWASGRGYVAVQVSDNGQWTEPMRQGGA